MYRQRAGMEMMSNGDCPVDILIEILLKLPVKSILRFKSVAKTWNHLFENPSFVSQHHSISKKSKLLVFCVWGNRAWPIRSISIRSFVDGDLVSYHDLGQQLPSDFAPMNYSFDICIDNGLFCLLDRRNSVLTLWNPATREFRNLPECNLSFPIKRYAYLAPTLGFGLDPFSNDYKKMSTDSWRVLKEEEVRFSPDLDICRNISNACVNGVYYWLAPRKVVAFHLGSEDFELIESPLSEPREKGQLLILHDRISIWDTEFDVGRNRSNEVWVLNDEGQWTKVLKIEPVLEIRRLIGFCTNSKVLVESLRRGLSVYDFESHEFKDLGIQPKGPGTFLQVSTKSCPGQLWHSRIDDMHALIMICHMITMAIDFLLSWYLPSSIHIHVPLLSKCRADCNSCQFFLKVKIPNQSSYSNEK
ncbi:hypothetical protein PTKIN_Ptkin16aG0531200 [Pterospermum kingtungense]